MALKLIYNASIITMDAAYPKAESMVINDLGKIESIERKHIKIGDQRIPIGDTYQKGFFDIIEKKK